METIPWDTLCVDQIGKNRFTPKGGGKTLQILPKGDEKKYKMTTKSGTSVYIHAVTMIDPATDCIEICTVPSARADLVANQAELAWLTRYPLPNKVIMDRGNEFLAEFREMISNDNGIMVKPITSRNTQANAILERLHQMIGNILRTFKVQNMELDDQNPCEGILAFTMFALRATAHTPTQYTPAQFIFGRRNDVDWEVIRKHKQDLINKGNERENRNEINHMQRKQNSIKMPT